MDITFNGRALGPYDAFAKYRTMLSDLYDTEPNAGAFEPVLAIDAWALERVLIHSGSHMPAHYTRGPVQISRSGYDDISVMLVQQGEYRATIGDRRSVCGAGSLLVLDRLKAVRLSTTANRMANFSFPRRELERMGIDVTRVHGARLDTAAGAVLARTLEGLASNREAPPSIEAPLLELCAIAMGDPQDGWAAERHNRLKDAAVAIIRERLTDESLSVESLCEKLGTSRAPLYRAFTGEGGVHAFIRRERLAESRRRLAGGEARISSVALDLGFGSSAHFSRLFRKQYGLAPRNFAQPGGSPGSTTATLSRLGRWNALSTHR